MRVLGMIVLLSFGLNFSAFADQKADEERVSTCLELEDMIGDLQGRLFAMETKMRMEVYPSCMRGRLSASLSNYCDIESNLSFVIQSYIDRCEGDKLL